MRTFKKIIAGLAIFAFLLISAGTVSAATPTVSVSADPNNSDYVNIYVTGLVNHSVVLYYYSTGVSGPQMTPIGTTNSNGIYSGSLSLSQYNIIKNTQVKVMIGGEWSQEIIWPFDNTSTSSTSLSFSQSSLVLNIGQSGSVTANNIGSKTIYLASNSNPQVANISISGNQVSVIGVSAGQTTANLCLLNYASSCTNLYIIVQNSSNQSLSFSQNNISVMNGQNVQITISGGNGFYQISNNSNSSVIGTNLNGPTLTLYGNATVGTSTITVCSSDMNACGVVNASIGNYNSAGLNFSQTNPTVLALQTLTINIYGGYGNYYISTNSNSNIVQAYTSTSTVVLYGSQPGTANITVCASSGACGVLTVTVNGSTGGALALNQNNVVLLSGQTSSVMVTGGRMPYSINPNNSGIVQYTLNGSNITLNGISGGSSSADICSAGGGCIVLNVTVSGASNNTNGLPITLSQNSISLNPSQTQTVYITGNGGYYISSNSNPTALSAMISGNSIVLSGLNTGSATVSVCQTGGQCNTLYVTITNAVTTNNNPVVLGKNSVELKAGSYEMITVTGGSGTGYTVSSNSNSSVAGAYAIGSTLIVSGKTAGSSILSVCSSNNVCSNLSVTVSAGTSTSNTNTSSVTNATKHKFTVPLKLGSSGNEVKQLQLRLKELGYFNGPVTGYYGNLTVAAVKKFQKANKLDQLGNVGPGTRAALNK